MALSGIGMSNSNPFAPGLGQGFGSGFGRSVGGGFGAPFGMGDQAGVSQEAQEEMTLVLLALVAMLMQGEGGGMGGQRSGDGGGSPEGGMPGAIPGSHGGGSPGGGQSGGSSPGGGTSPGGGSSPAGTGGVTAPNGSGEKAVQIAQSQFGVQCQNIKLPGYNVDGRHTNGCANFVTAVEEGAGRYKATPGDPLVSTFEGALKNQGWKAVDRGQAKPGDVAIFHNSSGGDQHTEIVANNGGTKLIGNNGDAQEAVSYDSGQWGTPTFYTPG